MRFVSRGLRFGTMTPWFALYRRLFFRRAGSPSLLERLGGRLLPRPCMVCGVRTVAWAPTCDLHRFEPDRPGNVNP